MSETNELVQKIKQATDFEHNKRNLFEKIQIDLHLAYQGGLFKLSPELICYIGLQKQDVLIVLDVYNNPIKITDVTEFFDLCRQQYQKVLNTYYEMHDQLRQTRKI